MLKCGVCLLELSLYLFILALHYFLNEFIFNKLIPIQTVLSSEVLGECHGLRLTHSPLLHSNHKVGGQVFTHRVILAWVLQNSRICPLLGQK